jgi:DNA adenine methylase
MASRLSALKGKFILSLNDRTEVRETFKEFRIQREEIAYTAQARPGKRYGELLITNY